MPTFPIERGHTHQVGANVLQKHSLTPLQFLSTVRTGGILWVWHMETNGRPWVLRQWRKLVKDERDRDRSLSEIVMYPFLMQEGGKFLTKMLLQVGRRGITQRQKGTCEDPRPVRNTAHISFPKSLVVSLLLCSDHSLLFWLQTIVTGTTLSLGGQFFKAVQDCPSGHHDRNVCSSQQHWYCPVPIQSSTGFVDHIEG